MQYLQDVCDKYQITDKFQFNTDVSEIRWLEDEELWEATLTHMVAGIGDLSSKDRQAKLKEHGPESVYLRKEKVRAKIVCPAAGGLVEPNAWPDKIPGLDTFTGEIFHSARWRPEVDFNDKDVVVVGTGCSAAQFVPRLPKPPYNAKSVTQVMRSPPWVMPRPEPPFGEEKWAERGPKLLSNFPIIAKLMRLVMFLGSEYHFYYMFATSPNRTRPARRPKKARSAG